MTRYLSRAVALKRICMCHVMRVDESFRSSVLHYDAACCGMLQCVAVCCSVLYCVAMCCNALQRVAVFCSVLQQILPHHEH